MLNRNDPIPLYEQLKSIIEDDIKNGKLQYNDQIPSERELCQQFNVSRITVRQAISLAEKEGLVQRLHGVGTFVAKPKIQQELTTINNFKSTLEKQGLLASTKYHDSKVISSDFQLSRLLHIDVMDKVLNLQLVGLGDDSPIVFYNSYFEYNIGMKIKESADVAIEKNIPFSTLDLYDNVELTPTHVEQTFESVAANEHVSDILHVETGFPLLRITSIVFQDTLPLEYKESYYRGDKYRFFITRKW
ncbi:GntR family transcriptional regulator [Siminovitchia sp. FSL W7-1587]|uniref:GntR family transcriptional regulator n=1 Tax=Siminovitchia sp. FSL W7-1587 TaxID=2954699 RepID=UPI0030D184C6